MNLCFFALLFLLNTQAFAQKCGSGFSKETSNKKESVLRQISREKK